MYIQDESQKQWNHAYERGGNICFYPHEEVIRFVNKYIRKRDGINLFHNVMNLTEHEWCDFKSLDLGCGIGRHVKFLEEFGLNPFGIDLSDAAISMGRSWFQQIGKNDLAQRLTVGSVENLPYENESFQICVSHGTLDSMPREVAVRGMKEAIRVLKTQGLMYLDLIMDTQKGDKDEIVDSGYEKDTVQSYFTAETIRDFLGKSVEIVDFKIIVWRDEREKEFSRRAHIIIRKK